MGWRVVATQQGQYNQVIRNPGEVFDLLCHADGSYPAAVKYNPRKDAKQNVIPDEWDEEVIKGKDNKPVHRDFAEDQGNKLLKSGPKKGEVMRFGWMRRVPDHIHIGQYQTGKNGELPDFWATGLQLPAPTQTVPDMRERGPEDSRRNHARILDVLPPEVTEAA